MSHTSKLLLSCLLLSINSFAVTEKPNKLYIAYVDNKDSAEIEAEYYYRKDGSDSLSVTYPFYGEVYYEYRANVPISFKALPVNMLRLEDSSNKLLYNIKGQEINLKLDSRQPFSIRNKPIIVTH